MIPAAIQAPQAVAETINSFCPPGLSVAPVGTTIALYRGASKTPFVSFAYTGPDSVLGIVVAAWRIALADHGQPVTNITNVSPDVEKMKALVDALEILGWSHALEPTAFARSYLVIEQQSLAEAREAAAQAESRVRALESESADRLNALRVLGYHPDMNLGEWAEARVKQRDETEAKLAVAHKALSILGWIPLSCEPVPWAESKLAEIDANHIASGNLRRALDEHAARIRAANEQASRNLRQLERIDTILEGGQIDQANGERERKLLNLVAIVHRTAARVVDRGFDFDVPAAAREFGPELRRLRESHGLRLGELARVLGCKVTVLSDLELGLTGTAGSRGPSTADWDAINHPPGPDEPKAHERATWHLDRALAFIERSDGWVLHPGQDFHGYIIQARNAAAKAEREIADIKASTRAGAIDIGALLERFPTATMVTIIDNHGLVPASPRITRVRSVRGKTGRYSIQANVEEGAQVLLEVLGDGSVEVHKNRDGQVGRILSPMAMMRERAENAEREVAQLKGEREASRAEVTAHRDDAASQRAKVGELERDIQHIVSAYHDCSGKGGPASASLVAEMIKNLYARRVYSDRWLKACEQTGMNAEADPALQRPDGADKLVAFIERSQGLLVKPLRDLVGGRPHGAYLAIPERVVELAAERIQTDFRELERLRAANRDAVAKIESAPGSGLRKRLKEAERIAGNPVELERLQVELEKIQAQIRMATLQRNALHAAAREEATGTQSPFEVAIQAEERGWRVETPARAAQPKTVQTPLFVVDGDSRFKIADARCWKRGDTEAQDRVGRAWVSTISGSCAGMTGLPFKPGPTVRFVDADDKLVLAGKVIRYESKNITGDRLEWEAEVLHEVDVPGLMRDVTADAKAPRVTDEQRQSACFIVGDKVLAGPRWTGITWMSKKGRAKTFRIEDMMVTAVASPKLNEAPAPASLVIKVPTSPWNLPAKLVRRIHAGKQLSFHIALGRVIKGSVVKVDASAISSMLLFVAT